MTTVTTIALACAAAAALWGALGMPRAVDALLRYKMGEIWRNWDKKCGELELAMTDGRIPEGTDPVLVEWASRQRAQVGGRKLPREETERLKAMGVVSEGVKTEGLGSREDEEGRYTLPSTPAVRAACALACALAPLGLAALSAAGAMLPDMACPVAAAALGTLAWLTMCAVMACDIRAKNISWQLCILLAAISVPFSLASSPADAAEPMLPAAHLACGALGGVGVYLACKLVNGAMRFLTGAGAIGNGDLRLMPVICLACGLKGTIAGFAAATALMCAIAVIALARGADRRTYVPYAPGLAAWMLTGMLFQMSTMGGVAL